MITDNVSSYYIENEELYLTSAEIEEIENDLQETIFNTQIGDTEWKTNLLR